MPRLPTFSGLKAIFLMMWIRTKTSNIGAEIEALEKKEVSDDFYLPPRFVKIPTTELEDIGRKLDIGIDELVSIDRKK